MTNRGGFFTLNEVVIFSRCQAGLGEARQGHGTKTGLEKVCVK
jgi:hypothetical protein